MRRSKHPVKRVLWLEKGVQTEKETYAVGQVRLVDRGTPKDQEKIKGYQNTGYTIVREKRAKKKRGFFG